MNQPNSRPLRTCDIVMKGGITSGVVYPSAITTLAERFIFKNIGGTSAGAIAASVAAAAELRRSRDGSNAGFAQLSQLPDLLGQKSGAGQRTRLFLFFQPDDRTRRIFNLLTSALGQSRPILVLLVGALTKYAGWTLAGALPGVVLAILTAQHFGGGKLVCVWFVVSLLLLLAGAMIAPAIGFIREFIREIPRNNFGMCSGLSGKGDKPGTALTNWLSAYLNEAAGLPANGEPLTFGHLWNTHESDQDKAPRLVNLEMMTTNLTHGRPYRLPFRDDTDLRENYLFYFRQDEFSKLFPEKIVQWMLAHPRPIPEGDTERAERRARLAENGFYPLPAPADLPVMVATRMSLSFPILLCAVPLHAIDRSVFPDNELPERCWFSDGGMCSNFPIHFFDTALPRRPTFSIDLAEKPGGTPKSALVPEMPETNSADIADHWNRFDTETPTQINAAPAEKPAVQRLLGFFFAMINTMQNWTDATQGRLPGFRDRIVTVPLTPEEGGLNLDMPPQRISDLSARGVMAARLLEKHFDVPAGEKVMTWDNHRWIRLRSFLASQEKALDQLVTACEQPENGDRGFERWLADLSAVTSADGERAPSYLMNKDQLAAAQKTLAELRAIDGLWNHVTAEQNAPRPRPVLRPRAQI